MKQLDVPEVPSIKHSSNCFGGRGQTMESQYSASNRPHKEAAKCFQTDPSSGTFPKNAGVVWRPKPGGESRLGVEALLFFFVIFCSCFCLSLFCFVQLDYLLFVVLLYQNWIVIFPREGYFAQNYLFNLGCCFCSGVLGADSSVATRTFFICVSDSIFSYFTLFFFVACFWFLIHIVWRVWSTGASEGPVPEPVSPPFGPQQPSHP